MESKGITVVGGAQRLGNVGLLPGLNRLLATRVFSHAPTCPCGHDTQTPEMTISGATTTDRTLSMDSLLSWFVPSRWIRELPQTSGRALANCRRAASASDDTASSALADTVKNPAANAPEKQAAVR